MQSADTTSPASSAAISASTLWPEQPDRDDSEADACRGGFDSLRADESAIPPVTFSCGAATVAFVSAIQTAPSAAAVSEAEEGEVGAPLADACGFSIFQQRITVALRCLSR